MSASGDAPAKRRSRREERKEETRGELIAAAARAFAHHGYHGASLDQIARDAGYSTGAIYWHFSGKEDLFLGVYEAYAAARAREFDYIHARAQGSTGERARAYADQWMARLSRDPDFLVLSVEPRPCLAKPAAARSVQPPRRSGEARPRPHPRGGGAQRSL